MDYPRIGPPFRNQTSASVTRALAKLVPGDRNADATAFAHNVVSKANRVSGFKLRTLILVTLVLTNVYL